MKPDEEVVGEACRIELDETTGKLFLTFEITSEKYKKDLKTKWTNDIKFKIINKLLIINK